MITGEVEAVDRKQKIRDRYKGVDISELEVIPAKIIEDLETSSVIRRVAAYIRVAYDITVAKNAIIWTTPCKESLQLVA